jgi:hypothetical protein
MTLRHIKRGQRYISTLDGGECSASCPACCSSRERNPSTHWVGEWISTTASLDVVANKKIHAYDTNQSPVIRL